MIIKHIEATDDFYTLQETYNKIQHVRAAIQDLNRNPGDREVGVRTISNCDDLHLKVDVPTKELKRQLKRRETILVLEFISQKAKLEAIFVL